MPAKVKTGAASSSRFKAHLAELKKQQDGTQHHGSICSSAILVTDDDLMQQLRSVGVFSVPQTRKFYINSKGNFDDPTSVSKHFGIVEELMSFFENGQIVFGPLQTGHEYTVMGELLPEVIASGEETVHFMRSYLSQRARRIAFAYDRVVLDHVNPLSRIPETPQRVQRAIEDFENHIILREYILDEKNRINSRLATPEEIYAVHDKSLYSDFIERGINLCKNIELSSDVYCNDGDGSRMAVLTSAGLVIDAGKAVACENIFDGAFCLIRPPGHHCQDAKPNGFCLVNNIVISITALHNAQPGLKVAVVDCDVHHGEGIQALIEGNSNILYYSTHRSDKGSFFPYNTGLLNDYGENKQCINVPFDTEANNPATCYKVLSDEAYTACAEFILKKALKKFQPDIVFVACGFDAMYGDQLGQMAVTVYGYMNIIQAIRDSTKTTMTAHKEKKDSCGIVVVLEGGYNAANVSHGSLGVFSSLLFDAQDSINCVPLPPVYQQNLYTFNYNAYIDIITDDENILLLPSYQTNKDQYETRRENYEEKRIISISDEKLHNNNIINIASVDANNKNTGIIKLASRTSLTRYLPCVVPQTFCKLTKKHKRLQREYEEAMKERKESEEEKNNQQQKTREIHHEESLHDEDEKQLKKEREGISEGDDINVEECKDGSLESSSNVMTGNKILLEPVLQMPEEEELSRKHTDYVRETIKSVLSLHPYLCRC